MSSDKVLYACLTKHPAQKISLTALGTGRPVPEVRAAFLNRIQWPQKSEIRVCFLRKPFDNNGETLDPQYAPEKAAFVQMIVMKKLAPIVNLTFTWDVSQSSSNVRISFVKGLGAYSRRSGHPRIWSFTGPHSRAQPGDERHQIYLE